jgi:hypothetical protein
MIAIPIPIEVEEAVKAAENRRIAALKETPKLIERSAKPVELTLEKVVNDYIRSLHRIKPATVFYEVTKEASKKNKMSQFLDASVKRIKSLPKDVGSVLFKKLVNPKTKNGFVGKLKPDGAVERVQSLETLQILFSAIVDAEVREEAYFGSDRNYATLMSAALPQGYVAVCTRVALGDLFKLDRAHFYNKNVSIRMKESSYPEKPELEIACATEPILSSVAGMEKYHRITFKLEKKNNTISAWYPGAYSGRNPAGLSLEDQPCYLGR